MRYQVDISHLVLHSWYQDWMRKLPARHNKAAPLTVASDLCEDSKVSSSGPGNDIVFTLVLERPAKPNTENKGQDDL